MTVTVDLTAATVSAAAVTDAHGFWYGTSSLAPATFDSIPPPEAPDGFTVATARLAQQYFEDQMRRMVATGRVRYFPLCTLSRDGDGEPATIRNKLTGATFTVSEVRRKHVDATYSNVELPVSRPPPYPVESGAICTPPHELHKLQTPASKYVVIGAGRTGMDCCVWLLQRGVAPDKISWIMPSNSWVYITPTTHKHCESTPSGTASHALPVCRPREVPCGCAAFV